MFVTSRFFERQRSLPCGLG